MPTKYTFNCSNCKKKYKSKKRESRCPSCKQWNTVDNAER